MTIYEFKKDGVANSIEQELTALQKRLLYENETE